MRIVEAGTDKAASKVNGRSLRIRFECFFFTARQDKPTVINYKAVAKIAVALKNMGMNESGKQRYLPPHVNDYTLVYDALHFDAITNLVTYTPLRYNKCIRGQGGRNVYPGGFSETACAILSLTTRLAWEPQMPRPLPHSVVRRMLRSRALEGLVLRETPEIEAMWLERARILLTRVRNVAEGMQAYSNAGYELLLADDKRWPPRLRVLGAHEPLFLFIKGNAGLLGQSMISVAGSRKIQVQTQAAAKATGVRVAQSGAVLVTGGACGTDAYALEGALEADGSVIVVPALSAARILSSENSIQAMKREKLLLVCDTLPDEPFSAAKALSRNHTIYALGDASLVVAARDGRGGSWRGATDCLRGGWSPVFVWDGVNPDTAGNRALCELGANRYSLDMPIEQQLMARNRQISLFGEE